MNLKDAHCACMNCSAPALHSNILTMRYILYAVNNSSRMWFCYICCYDTNSIVWECLAPL